MNKKFKNILLEFINEEAINPMTARELAYIFEVKKSEIKMLENILSEMEKEGLLFKTSKGKYAPPEKLNLFIGEISVHQKGFGFVMSEKFEQDLFIPASAMNGALHKDIVVARILKASTDNKKMEGEILKVLKRANDEVVGVFEPSRNFGFVIADNKRFNKDIYIPKKKTLNARKFDKVIVKITKWPKEGRNPEGEIIEILGQKDDVGVDILSIIKEHNLRSEFPKKVMAEANNIPDEIDKSEIERRVDLRDKIIFTIDGADAKDLDDAISIEKLDNNNYKLGVHIADVTNYVKEGSKLDKEALKRGTSVYLTDRVIPMLPKKLSNGVCSLHPNVDRLTLSVFMEIDSKGKVLKSEIKETVINSKERLVYEDISDIIENNDEELANKYKNIQKEIKLMDELAKILMKRRDKRGAIDFDFPEAKIILDEEGKPIDIKKYERRIANRIIEEFMLVCNETVAEEYFWLDLPFVYRIHENPDSNRIAEFNKFLSIFGYNIKGNLEEVHSKEFKKLIQEIKGKKEELVISTLMLRSLKQAKYSPHCDGHFGLSAKYYCHFTSPIRRYPDLQIHRIIKEHINKKLDAKRITELRKIVEMSSSESSTKEREAEDAQRQVDDLKKAQYMSYRIGKVYEGVVSSVTSFGIFVELENTIEGRVSMNSLDDDYYIYDSQNYTLIGEHTKKIYSIGDVVKVKVDSVNLYLREIEFSIVRD